LHLIIVAHEGGPSIEVLLDLALGSDVAVANEAAKVLKTQFFLYEADTDRLEAAFKLEMKLQKKFWLAMLRQNFYKTS
jgi:aconitate hydratase 2/2-methylisocitrate dehydratase